MSSLLPTPILSTLQEFRDIVRSHAGSDLTRKSEPTLSKVLDRFDSIIGNSGADDHATEATEREKSTDWFVLLNDAVGFLEKNMGLIREGKSQALRIDEDIGIFIDIARTKVLKQGINDKTYLVCFPLLSSREVDGGLRVC